VKIKRRIIHGDTVKIMLLRMWAAGAVCFFTAWGRAGAEEVGNSYSLDLIAGLILVLLLGDWIIVNPVIKLAFGQSGAADKKGWRKFLNSLPHIGEVTFSLLLVVETYYLLNVLFIHLFDLGAQAVPIPLEPLFFGIFYGLYFQLFEFLKIKAVRFFNKTA
jgi:hypothetical protein